MSTFKEGYPSLLCHYWHILTFWTIFTSLGNSWQNEGCYLPESCLLHVVNEGKAEETHEDARDWAEVLPTAEQGVGVSLWSPSLRCPRSSTRSKALSLIKQTSEWNSTTTLWSWVSCDTWIKFFFMLGTCRTLGKEEQHLN